MRTRIAIGAFLAAALTSFCALAADWTERPYDPPVGSRWIVQRDLSAEENENGKITKSTFKITSELKIEGKSEHGFRFMYARRSSTYDSDDAASQAQHRAVLGLLLNIEYRGEMDASGLPLRVDNVEEIKAALTAMIDRLAESDPPHAAVIRQTLAPMAQIDGAGAAKFSLDQIPDLAVAQNTGLKIGETRRNSVGEPTGIGPPLVTNRALSIVKADADSGDVRLVMTEVYDEPALRAFLNALLARMGRSGVDVREPEKNIKDMDMKLDGHIEYEVVGGMTRHTDALSVLTAHLGGTHRVTTNHKVTTVTPAP